MSPAATHLEKIVLGVVCVLALVVIVVHFNRGGTLRTRVAAIDSDVGALAAALKSPKAPEAGTGPTIQSADAVVAGLLTTATPEPTRSWGFARRPTLRGKPHVKPDLRKDHLPPVALTAVVEDFTVTVSWKPSPDATATVTGWRIYRFPKGGKRPEKPTAEVAPALTRWEDTEAAGLEPGSTLSYEVTALTAEENKQGGPESAPAGPADAALPYDRRLHYYGSAIIAGDGTVHGVTLGVSRFVDGDWRGPVEFSLKPGERIGAPRGVEIDGERVDIDFTTHWTLKDAKSVREQVVVEGQPPRFVEKQWLIVVDDAGVESRIDASEKPPRETGPRKPHNAVDAELVRLSNERNAARAAGDGDAVNAMGDLRTWLSGRKRRYLRGNTLVPERVQEDIESAAAEVADIDADIARYEEQGKKSRIPSLQKKKALLEGRITSLKNLLGWKG